LNTSKAASPADDLKRATDTNRHSISLHLEPEDNQRLTNLCGQFDQHLHQIEKHFDVIVSNRAFDFTISGLPLQIQKTINLLQELYDLTSTEQIAPEKIHLFLQESNHAESDKGESEDIKDDSVTATIRTKRGMLRGRGPNQNFYIRSIQTHDLTFGIGPAGTGKTYLAVACAVEALERDEVRRIVLVRPAVEAGEKLGFLPGDLSQKSRPISTTNV